MDLAFVAAEGRLLAGEIPGAQFVPIDSGNHLLLESEPGWAHWRDAVYTFLARGGADDAPPAYPEPTPRQRELLEGLVQGLDNAQIAARAGLSEKTVRSQVSAIFDKLGAASRSQAIVKAREAGFGRGGP